MGKKAAILLFIATVVISGCSTISQALDGGPEEGVFEEITRPDDPICEPLDPISTLAGQADAFTGNVAERIHNVTNAELVFVDSGDRYDISRAGVNSGFDFCPSEFQPRPGGDLVVDKGDTCLLYTSPSPRDQRGSRMPSSA